MAGEKSRGGEVKEGDVIETDERCFSVRRGDKVMDTAPGRSALRLNTISDLDPGQNKESDKPTGSSYAMHSLDQYSSRSSSTNSLSDLQDAGDACAGIVLDCLFCRFYELCVMLPDVCERAVDRVCPSYKYLSAPTEQASSSDWNCHCDFDCGLFDTCHETGECLELAMEISEICYR